MCFSGSGYLPTSAGSVSMTCRSWSRAWTIRQTSEGKKEGSTKAARQARLEVSTDHCQLLCAAGPPGSIDCITHRIALIFVASACAVSYSLAQPFRRALYLFCPFLSSDGHQEKQRPRKEKKGITLLQVLRTFYAPTCKAGTNIYRVVQGI